MACGLASSHSILVADKPTNGLDSSTAREFIENAKLISTTGESFIFSLVQPGPDIVNLLDRVLVLAKGSPVYWGPPQGMGAYFEGLGYVKPPQKGEPDFVDELIRHPARFLPNGAEPKGEETAIVGLEEGFLKSQGFHDLGVALWKEFHPTALIDIVPFSKKEYLTSFFYQVALAIRVQWTTALRHVEVFWGALARSIFVGFMIGTAFWNLGDSQEDARNSLGLLFYVLTVRVFCFCFFLCCSFVAISLLFSHPSRFFLSVPLPSSTSHSFRRSSFQFSLKSEMSSPNKRLKSISVLLFTSPLKLFFLSR